MSMQRAVNALGPMALSIVSLAVIIGIGSVVLAEIGNISVLSNETTAQNTIQAGQDALGTFGDFFGVIVVVAVAGVVFILLGSLRGAGRARTA